MPLISSGVVKGRRCPICGKDNVICGPAYHGQPVDIQEATVADSHDLYIYQDKDGNTFQMTEADAKEAGYTRMGGQSATDADAAREEAGGAQASDPDAPAQTKVRGSSANK